MSKLYAGHDLDMIRKAVEIQELWKVATRGDLYLLPEETIIRHVYLTTDACIKPFHETWINKTEVTWLPRQDKLQEMIPITGGNNLDLVKALFDWIENLNFYRDYVDLSMEQLWLAFVYYKKYNKYWDKDKWSLIK